VADTVSAKNGGTFSGNVVFNGNINAGTIKDATGTNTGLTINSSGQVSMPNTVEIDSWRLPADFATNSATVTGWERNDDATFSYAGTGMTESSGVFTFPKTGLYKVTGEFEITCSTSDSAATLNLMVSSDSGSTYDQRGYAVVRGTTADTDGAGGVSRTILVNVTDASAFRYKVDTSSFGSGSALKGNTNYDRTSILFERIADSQ
jgi:hypothetical protein